MKIQCSKCKSTYNIKDDKIPANGARVKCLKCQNIITIGHSLPIKNKPSPQSSKRESTSISNSSPIVNDLAYVSKKIMKKVGSEVEESRAKIKKIGADKVKSIVDKVTTKIESKKESNPKSKKQKLSKIGIKKIFPKKLVFPASALLIILICYFAFGDIIYSFISNTTTQEKLTRNTEINNRQPNSNSLKKAKAEKNNARSANEFILAENSDEIISLNGKIQNLQSKINELTQKKDTLCEEQEKYKEMGEENFKWKLNDLDMETKELENKIQYLAEQTEKLQDTVSIKTGKKNLTNIYDYAILYNASTSAAYMSSPPLDGPSDKNKFFLWSGTLVKKDGDTYFVWDTGYIPSGAIHNEIIYSDEIYTQGFAFKNIKQKYGDLYQDSQVYVIGRYVDNAEIILVSGERKVIPVLSDCIIFDKAYM